MSAARRGLRLRSMGKREDRPSSIDAWQARPASPAPTGVLVLPTDGPNPTGVIALPSTSTNRRSSKRAPTTRQLVAVIVVLVAIIVAAGVRPLRQAGALGASHRAATDTASPSAADEQDTAALDTPDPVDPDASTSTDAETEADTDGSTTPAGPEGPTEPVEPTAPAVPGDDERALLEAVEREAGGDLGTAEVIVGADGDADENGSAGGRPVLHLTFDDGPHPTYTPQILDTLARYDAKATFFVLGSLVERHPELFQRIVDEGHVVANHSWNHEDLAPLSRAEFTESVLRTQEALGPHANRCLRPPFGSLGPDTRTWATELGLEITLWDVDTLDWQRPGADQIAERVVDGARDGTVVLMHDGGGDRTETVAALDDALAELARQGYAFEPICG